MNTYAINKTTHDLYISNGQIARVSNSEAIAQTVKTRLLTVQEEWFLDLNAGLPWFTKMLGATPDLYKIRGYVAREIINTNGVEDLKTVELLYNKKDRKLDIEFTYVDIFGNTVSEVL